VINYVTLLKWTETGTKNIKDTVNQAEKASHLAEQVGGRLTNILWTQGPYDQVIISEFRDEESYLAFALALDTLGQIRTETLRSFTAQDIKRRRGA
jgi:uncharacterized protein with GYD domain